MNYRNIAAATYSLFSLGWGEGLFGMGEGKNIGAEISAYYMNSAMDVQWGRGYEWM